MERSFTWQGRQMKTANLNGTAVTYKYNADGLRTYKKVGSTVHEYEYSGDKLVYEKRGDTRFYYRYDAYGNPASITRITADGGIFTVYPITNVRGDVVELRLSNGNLYASYVYDTWGNVLHIYSGTGTTEITDTANLAKQNPFRYRGYYFDAESGLYYLQSRYYDPQTGRFVNGDSQLNTDNILGYNMFVYCYNNPVAYSDSEGNRPIVGAGPISKETADERKASCAAVKGRSYSASKSGKSIAESDKKEKSIINHVNKSHYTEDFGMLNLGYIFGKVGFSSTTTIYQDKEPALFYTFADVGNVDSKYGGRL